MYKKIKHRFYCDKIKMKLSLTDNLLNLFLLFPPLLLPLLYCTSQRSPVNQSLGATDVLFFGIYVYAVSVSVAGVLFFILSALVAIFAHI